MRHKWRNELRHLWRLLIVMQAIRVKMECPKCKYTRRTYDSNPDWQCPNCGIAYSKFGIVLGEDASKEPDLDLDDNARVMKDLFKKYSITTLVALVPVAVFKINFLYSLYFLLQCIGALLFARAMMKTGCSFGPMMVLQNKHDNPIMYKIEVASAFILAAWFLYLAIMSLLS